MELIMMQFKIMIMKESLSLLNMELRSLDLPMMKLKKI